MLPGVDSLVKRVSERDIGVILKCGRWIQERLVENDNLDA